MRSWVGKPLRQREAIEARLDAVAELAEQGESAEVGLCVTHGCTCAPPPTACQPVCLPRHQLYPCNWPLSHPPRQAAATRCCPGCTARCASWATWSGASPAPSTAPPAQQTLPRCCRWRRGLGSQKPTVCALAGQSASLKGFVLEQARPIHCPPTPTHPHTHTPTPTPPPPHTRPTPPAADLCPPKGAARHAQRRCRRRCPRCGHRRR